MVAYNRSICGRLPRNGVYTCFRNAMADEERDLVQCRTPRSSSIETRLLKALSFDKTALGAFRVRWCDRKLGFQSKPTMSGESPGLRRTPTPFTVFKDEVQTKRLKGSLDCGWRRLVCGQARLNTADGLYGDPCRRCNVTNAQPECCATHPRLQRSNYAYHNPRLNTPSYVSEGL